MTHTTHNVNTQRTHTGANGKLLRERADELLRPSANGQLLRLGAHGQLFRPAAHGQLFRAGANGQLFRPGADGQLFWPGADGQLFRGIFFGRAEHFPTEQYERNLDALTFSEREDCAGRTGRTRRLD